MYIYIKYIHIFYVTNDFILGCNNIRESDAKIIVDCDFIILTY